VGLCDLRFGNRGDRIASSVDLRDLQRCEPLTMSLFPAVVFPALMFENDNFLATLLSYNAGFYASLYHRWGTNGDGSPLPNHQNGAERYGIANLASELFDVDSIPWANAVLPSPGFHNGVHTLSFTLGNRAQTRCDALLYKTSDGRMKSTQN
jgi:hypothetical protein